MDTTIAATTKIIKRNRSLKIRSLQDLKTVVEYLSAHHCRRFVIDGIEIEFDTAIAAIHKAEVANETTEVQAAKDSKSTSLETLLKDDAEEALFWSSGK